MGVWIKPRTPVSGMYNRVFGADDGTRTCDLLFTKQLLYH